MEKGRRVGVKEVLGRGITAGAIFFGANFGLVSGKQISENPNPQKQSLVKKYQESIPGFILKWEAEHLPHKITDLFHRENLNQEEEVEIVNQYFNSNPRDKSLEPRVERILQKQITQVLEQEGITVFPPVLFKFTDQLNTVVIAPDDKAETKDRILMVGGINDGEKGKIEEEIEESRENISSFVVENGGWGFVYPTPVIRGTSLSYVAQVIPHEWDHPASIFTKVGRGYLKHISNFEKNEEIYSLAENAADILGKEIGNKVMEKFYKKEKVVFAKAPQKPSSSFDFNLEMKNLRISAERLFKEGKKEEAKQIMEKTREDFNKRGYPIRKINTAVFAAYGGYQDGPSPVVDNARTISEMMMELRELSGSLGNFIRMVSDMTAFKDLEEILNKRKPILEKKI